MEYVLIHLLVFTVCSVLFCFVSAPKNTWPRDTAQAFAGLMGDGMGCDELRLGFTLMLTSMALDGVLFLFSLVLWHSRQSRDLHTTI